MRIFSVKVKSDTMNTDRNGRTYVDVKKLMKKDNVRRVFALARAKGKLAQTAPLSR